MFGADRLKTVLAESTIGEAEGVCRAVLEALDAHRDPVEFADDVTLLVLPAE